MGKNIISEGERQNSSVPFPKVTRAEKNLAWLTPVILWESFAPGVLACSPRCPLERHSGTTVIEHLPLPTPAYGGLVIFTIFNRGAE